MNPMIKAALKIPGRRGKSILGDLVQIRRRTVIGPKPGQIIEKYRKKLERVRGITIPSERYLSPMKPFEQRDMTIPGIVIQEGLSPKILKRTLRHELTHAAQTLKYPWRNYWPFRLIARPIGEYKAYRSEPLGRTVSLIYASPKFIQKTEVALWKKVKQLRKKAK